MRWIAFLPVAVAAVAGVVASSAAASGNADEDAAALFGIRIPPGYRDWKLISVAQAAGGLLNSKTASLTTSRRSKPASLATSLSKLATLSSPITHLDHRGSAEAENKEFDSGCFKVLITFFREN